jgi:hypothetical protein
LKKEKNMRFLKACAFLVAVGAVAAFASPAQAQFPGQGDDPAVPSLGSFRIYVAAPWRNAFAAATYPGYNVITFKLQSPNLSGPTTIGRSAPHLHGSPADGGTPVGLAGTIIGDGNFTVQPGGFQGPAGTREVHTQVRSLNMIGPYGAAVRAGIDAPGRPISPGEVESHSPSGIPANDFPAESFFDIFAEVDLPFFPSTGTTATLITTSALLVKNDPLTEFPPKVVYIHGETPPVPVVFRDNNPPYWNKNDLFGHLILAGHGIRFDVDVPGDTALFNHIMSQQTEMKFIIVPTLSEWGAIILGTLLLGSGAFYIWRRRRVVTA